MEALLDRFKGPIIVALVALIAAGGGLLAGRQPARQALVISTPAPTATVVVTIKVHVSGAVARPGVYTLRLGDRVEDAIAAAGGATADGNPNALNLAARLVDGQQVMVGRAGEPAPAQSGLGRGAAPHQHQRAHAWPSSTPCPASARSPARRSSTIATRTARSSASRTCWT